MRRFLIYLAVTLAPSICGASEILAGPVAVSSNGLGYDSPYYGFAAEMRVEDPGWLGRASIELLDANKAGLRGGRGFRAAGELTRFVSESAGIVGGFRFLDQRQAEYGKSAFGFRVGALYRVLRADLSCGVEAVRQSDRSSQRAAVVRLDTPAPGGRIAVEFEHVRFERGSGNRVSVAYLIRLWRRNG